MKRIIRTLVTMFPITLLVACATNGEKAAKLDAAPTPVETEKTATAPAPETANAPEQARIESDQKQELTGPLAKRVVYFSFDKSDIKSEYIRIIQAHGAYLAKHPEIHIRLEGYTDERGTREYNMALGERRDNSVEDLLTMEGVAKDQIETVSYGEENPVAKGHDESSWHLNRRVKIVYLKKEEASPHISMAE